MRTARDIMTTPVLSVKEDSTIKEVIELLFQNRFSGVPVIDDDEKVIGILSDTDIVRYSHQVSVIPFADLSGWISPYTEVTDLASLRKGVDLLTSTRAAQVMTKKVYTVTEDTDSGEVARLMNRRNINRVPVIDTEGRLSGIVTRADIVGYLATGD